MDNIYNTEDVSKPDPIPADAPNIYEGVQVFCGGVCLSTGWLCCICDCVRLAGHIPVDYHSPLAPCQCGQLHPDREWYTTARQ
jgi:hypothetical protein